MLGAVPLGSVGSALHGPTGGGGNLPIGGAPLLVEQALSVVRMAASARARSFIDDPFADRRGLALVGVAPGLIIGGDLGAALVVTVSPELLRLALGRLAFGAPGLARPADMRAIEQSRGNQPGGDRQNWPPLPQEWPKNGHRNARRALALATLRWAACNIAGPFTARVIASQS